MDKKIILTGDRPTGKLHIGHYIGSLKNRVSLQESGLYESFIMIADQQALTDNARNPEIIAMQTFAARIFTIVAGATASEIKIGSISSDVDKNTASSVPTVMTRPA